MLVPQWYMQFVSHGVSCWLRCTSRCVPPWCSGPDALHHGRFGPEAQLCGFAVSVHHGRAASWMVVQTCRKLWFSTVAVLVSSLACPSLCTTGFWWCRRCSSSKVVDIPVFMQRFPSSSTRWPISLLCGSCRFSGAFVEGQTGAPTVAARLR